MSKVFVITGPSGVGKGTLIAELLERVPDLELSVSATTRQPREGEEDGRDYHFLAAGGVRAPGRARRLPRVRHLQRQPLRDAALGGRAAARGRATRSCSRSRSRAPSQVRAAMPESVQIFIAPPDPAVLRERLAGRGTDSPEAIDARLETAEAGARRAGRLRPPGRQRRPRAAAESWSGIVRAELADYHLDSAGR